MRPKEDSWYSVDIKGRVSTKHDTYSNALKKCQYPYFPIKGWMLNDDKEIKKYFKEVEKRSKLSKKKWNLTKNK